MPKKGASKPTDLAEWGVESLRLTVFPSPAAQIVQTPTWWTQLVGEPPEKSTSFPRTGRMQEEGSVDGGRLILIVQPLRIDWGFTVSAEKDQEGEGGFSIGKFPDILNMFIGRIRGWFEFETCPSANRLAFGAILLRPVENLQKGYEGISEFLPDVKIDASGSSDFLYQINRPRSSTGSVSSLKINRLMKWSVAMTMSFKLDLASARQALSDAGQNFACRLELDINTAAEFEGELSREQMPQILTELVDLAKEIAREGDIP